MVPPLMQGTWRTERERTGKGFFYKGCSDRTRDNGFRLKKEIFRSDIRKKSFPVKVGRPGTDCPEKL